MAAVQNQKEPIGQKSSSLGEKKADRTENSGNMQPSKAAKRMAAAATTTTTTTVHVW